jgi:hypothetical protein
MKEREQQDAKESAVVVGPMEELRIVLLVNGAVGLVELLMK